MKKYLFTQYSDKGGIGSEQLFDTKEEALKCADREWEGLTKSDKARRDWFYVCEIEITAEQLEEYEEGDGLPLEEYWTADIKNYK